MEQTSIVTDRLNILIGPISSFCKRYQVRELALFGSILRDDFRDDSDIDVLVEFQPEAQIGFLTLSRMQRELSTIFTSASGSRTEIGFKAANLPRGTFYNEGSVCVVKSCTCAL